jgi:hypothetical protein
MGCACCGAGYYCSTNFRRRQSPGAVNDHQQAFNEMQGVLLTADLDVDGGFISAGTTVNNYMIFLNIEDAGPVADPNVRWLFDGEILGIMSDTCGTILPSKVGILIRIIGSRT